MPSLNWLACLHLLFVKNLGIIIYSTLSVNFSIELRWYSHYAKSVRIRILVRIFSYSDQNNSECGHFLRSDRNWITYYLKLFDVPDKPSSPLPNTHLSIRKNFRYLDSGYLEHFDSSNKVFPHERFFPIISNYCQKIEQEFECLNILTLFFYKALLSIIIFRRQTHCACDRLWMWNVRLWVIWRMGYLTKTLQQKYRVEKVVFS